MAAAADDCAGCDICDGSGWKNRPADAPGPWDVETAEFDRLTTLAEERLAGLDRLRAECDAWQKASAGWQARCGELEGLLGEAGVRRDQYKTMYYHLRERLERAEAMRGESTPTG